MLDDLPYIAASASRMSCSGLLSVARISKQSSAWTILPSCGVTVRSVLFDTLAPVPLGPDDSMSPGVWKPVLPPALIVPMLPINQFCAAIGLCTSRDGGATWDVEQDGLHASYCSAIAFVGEDVLVSASEHHFAARGAIYRRRVDDGGPLVAIAGGLPEWIDGIADTGCIATHGSTAALADRKGNLYVSTDAGRSWSRRAEGLSAPSGVLIVERR